MSFLAARQQPGNRGFDVLPLVGGAEPFPQLAAGDVSQSSRRPSRRSAFRTVLGEHSQSAAVTVAITAPAGAAVLGDMPLRRHHPPSKQAGPSLPILYPGRPWNQPKR